jgi:DDE superfamily endonuclease/Helix-turn-helix domain
MATFSTPTKDRFKSSDLSRDERLQIQTLRNAGWSLNQIADHLGCTWSQAQYACATEKVTPCKRSGRPPLLTPSQIEELITFVCFSKATRRMPYHAIPLALHWDCSVYAIRYALKQAGFKRYVAYRKPPIIEKNRVIRLEKSLQRKDWPMERWEEILWSDETWVTAGRHRKTYVTRREDEALDPNCIVEREQRPRGWMFWGSYSVKYGKGPCLFWEKDWGSITAEKYSEKVVPLVCGWFRMHSGQIFMQDNASSHVAALTRKELEERNIPIYDHPPFSPDLNPIENAWNWMKDYIGRHFPAKMSYDQLRAAVKEAWEAIPEDFLRDLVYSMHDRCLAVIDANGMHTKY